MRVLGVCVVSGALWLSAAVAHAAFVDAELSAGNAIAAGTTDIVLQQQTVITQNALEPGQHAQGSVRVVNQGSVRTRYHVRVVANGDQCSALTLRIEQGSTVLYDGALTNGALSAADAITGGNSDTLTYTATATAPAYGSACVFALRIEASPQTPGVQQGFYDIEQTADSSVATYDPTPPSPPTPTGWTTDTSTTISCNGTTVTDGWTRDASAQFSWTAVATSTAYVYTVTAPDGTVTSAQTTDTVTPGIALSDGDWTFRVRAVRGALVGSDSSPCVLHVDRTPPTPTSPVVINTTIPPTTPLARNYVTMDFTTSEEAFVEVYYDTAPGNVFDYTTYAHRYPPAGTSPTYVTQQKVALPFPEPGDYRFILRMIDRAGNVFTTPTLTFNVASVLVPLDVISLNEIMPNPVGSDDAPMPQGEWVELFNRGTVPVDLNGWYITDATGRRWTIRASNSDADGDPSDGGETIIAPGGYLVVYRNGTNMTLNNTTGDEVTLFNASGVKIDSHLYNVSAHPEGKSVARFPDGTGIWIDPDPTPGGDNTLGEKETAVLRQATFVQCFKESATLVEQTRGTLCDPAFLHYIGMIDRTNSRTLARMELLEDATEQDESSEHGEQGSASPDSDKEATETRTDTVSSTDVTDEMDKETTEPNQTDSDAELGQHGDGKPEETVMIADNEEGEAEPNPDDHPRPLSSTMDTTDDAEAISKPTAPETDFDAGTSKLIDGTQESSEQLAAEEKPENTTGSTLDVQSSSEALSSKPSTDTLSSVTPETSQSDEQSLVEDAAASASQQPATSAPSTPDASPTPKQETPEEYKNTPAIREDAPEDVVDDTVEPSHDTMNTDESEKSATKDTSETDTEKKKTSKTSSKQSDVSKDVKKSDANKKSDKNKKSGAKENDKEDTKKENVEKHDKKEKSESDKKGEKKSESSEQESSTTEVTSS